MRGWRKDPIVRIYVEAALARACAKLADEHNERAAQLVRK
jgi:hypothetical protein